MDSTGIGRSGDDGDDNGGDDDDEEGSSTDGHRTSASEIVQHLFAISDGEQTSLADRKYSLRYWMAAILVRWPKLSEDKLQGKFKVPRNTVKNHLLKSPAECEFVPPTHRKYPPCTADQIIECLCYPDKDIEITNETYAVRFWSSIIVLKFQKIDRTYRGLEKWLDVSHRKINEGSKKNRTSALLCYNVA